MNNWREHRTKALESARRVVVKVGSAVLTTQQGLNLRIISRLVDQLAALHDKGLDIILVSSGAVAAGRSRISLDRDMTIGCKQAASAVGQSRLMHEYDETFARYGKITAQVLLTRDDFRDRARFLNAKNTVAKLLEWRVIPVVNENDTVTSDELKFGDNDTMAGLVLSLVKTDLLINLTTAGGVFTENPMENPKAKRLDCIKDIACLDLEQLCSGKTDAGSGGMYSKLLSAKRVAQLGVPTVILSGDHPLTFERLFSGEDIGTWIMPQEKTISRRKFWLAYHDQPCGRIVVDRGAALALTAKGKSLLPAGITSVEGKFASGDLVSISTGEGRAIGVGLTNYTSSGLLKVMGKNSKEIQSIFGDGHDPEAIHRDNMLINAAV